MEEQEEVRESNTYQVNLSKVSKRKGGIGSRPIYPYARSLAGAFARYLHSDESVCVHRQGVPTFGHVATSNSALAFVSIVN